MSAPSQISIFPATSATAVRLVELLQQQHPQIRVRLAGRTPSKLQATGVTSLSLRHLSTPPMSLPSRTLSRAARQPTIMNPPFTARRTRSASLRLGRLDHRSRKVEPCAQEDRLPLLVGSEKESGIGPIRNTRIAELGFLANLRDGVELYALRPNTSSPTSRPFSRSQSTHLTSCRR